MNWAIIENDEVINIIVADAKFIKDNKLKAICVDDMNVYIGAKVVDGELINPEPIIIPEKVKEITDGIS
jgi:hypothetical protein